MQGKTVNTYLLMMHIMLGEINQSSQLFVNNQPPEQSPLHRQLNASKISEKIEMMRQSITQLSVLSKGRNIENVLRLQQQQQSAATFVEQEQRKLLLELTQLEQNIAQMERERMVQSAKLANHRIAQEHALNSYQQEARGENRQNRECFEQYRDKITDLKVQLAEVEVAGRERLAKFERDCEVRVGRCEKSIEMHDQERSKSKLDGHFKQLKKLRTAIDEQGKSQQRQLKRLSSQVQSLKHLVSSTFQQEQRRQKDGFSQNYKMLQEFFLFMSQQYGVER